MRFRTQSGSLYVLEDQAVTRLNEEPMNGSGLQVDHWPYERHTPIEIGDPVIFFLTDDDRYIYTTPVTEILP
jgi:hypothetical protein